MKNMGRASGCDRGWADRTDALDDDLPRPPDGDAVFLAAADYPDEIRESDLEDILAFESVRSGPSMFEGLQQNGVKLPAPEELDEQGSAMKVVEVLRALMRLRIFLVGFDHMNAREFYSTLYHQTLWEGCYVRKRNPDALTIIDVSHSLSRSDIVKWLEDLNKGESVH